MRAAAILSITGGVCELVGLVIVALGIVRDRRRARTLLADRPPGAPRERHYPSHRFPRSTTPLASGMTTPATSQRALAEWVAKIDAATYNAHIEMQKLLDTQLDESIDALRGETTGADNELRGHLRYLLAGRERDRWIGVVVLGLGIALSTAGSVAGAS
jgi:hypothetical protein